MLGADVGGCACADSPLNRKLVIIGDGACGKTSLLSVFTLGYFPTVSPSWIDRPLTLRLLTCF
jgi:GTPase SAR1 family protein